MQCIILDGYHAGGMIGLPSAPEVLRMPVPERIICCECDPENEYLEPKLPEVREYRIAARGTDCCLYTVKGDLFGALTKGRAWIQPARGVVPSYPLYIHCQDERAWR